MSRELTVELEGDVMTLKNSGAPAAAPGDGHFRPPHPPGFLAWKLELRPK